MIKSKDEKFTKVFGAYFRKLREESGYTTRDILGNHVLNLLGCHIMTLRKERSLTLVQLAIRSKVDPCDISEIERGETNSVFATLFKLSIGLDVTMAELIRFYTLRVHLK